MRWETEPNSIVREVLLTLLSKGTYCFSLGVRPTAYFANGQQVKLMDGFHVCGYDHLGFQQFVNSRFNFNIAKIT